jgi:hydrogenase/urease accessory protein HupE
MHNNKILALNFIFMVFSSNAYSHTGAHNDGVLKTLIHFATSPDHVLFIIAPAIIILGFVIFYARKYFT